MVSLLVVMWLESVWIFFLILKIVKSVLMLVIVVVLLKFMLSWLGSLCRLMFVCCVVWYRVLVFVFVLIVSVLKKCWCVSL